ncbi:hypothetical protein JCM16303_002741 [Sporobolomyces ruberrimus]
MTQKLKCLIVGAGSSGLTAAKQALSAGLEPTLYEAREGPGGAWKFDPEPGTCNIDFNEEGWATCRNPGESDFAGRSAPSPMYDSLHTNVPTSIMQYRGSPFKPDVSLFCSHDQVQAYLEDYASPLSPYIHYNHRVNRIRYTTPSDGGDQRKWYAEIASTVDSSNPTTIIREQFDFVMVANGHYSKPFVPWTEGLRRWKGEITHARWYRNADAFKEKTVLVIGNSASGYDITREIATSIHNRRNSSSSATTLPKIYQSARSPSNLGIPFDSPDAPDWAGEIEVFPPIRKVEEWTITFEDGRTLTDVDTIIFATGYYFSFPFLHSSDAPWSSHPITRPPPTPSSSSSSTAPVEGGLRLHNLDDRFLFYLPDPTIVFLCLPYLVIPFPLAQIQSRLSTLYFTNSPQLPQPLSFVPGTSEEVPETRESVVFGHPRQYDLMDRMMEESGDTPTGPLREVNGNGTGKRGGKDGRKSEESVFGKTSQAERDLRKGAKALRRAVLGY